MRKVTNITKEPYQEHIINYENKEIILEIRYSSTTLEWNINVSYNQKFIYGVRMSCGVALLSSYNFPFDFVCVADKSNPIDPMLINDFASGRVCLYLIERNEIASVRGYDVE